MTQLVRSGVSRRTGRRAASSAGGEPGSSPARAPRASPARPARSQRPLATLADDGEQAQRGEQPHLRPPEAMAISPQLWRKRRFLSSDFLPERWGPEAFLAW